MTYNKPEVRFAGSALESVQNTPRTKGLGSFIDSQGDPHKPNSQPQPAYQADE